MNRIITIGREFGSGGRELGRRLSELLGVAYYDQEIVREISKRTELSERYIRQIAERQPSASFPISIGHSFYSIPNPALQQSISVFSAQHKLLKELADKSDCIIVGRCADYILREENPFRIFVYADQASKLERCMARRAPEERLTEQEMKKKMAEIDRSRARYYDFFSDLKWGGREHYDLLVNTSGKDIKQTARAVYEYVKTVLA